MSGALALVVDQRGARLELGTHHTVVLVHADGRRERVGLRAQRELLAPALFATGAEGAVRLTPEGRALFYPLWFREGWRTARRPMRDLLAGLLAPLRHAAPGSPEVG